MKELSEKSQALYDRLLLQAVPAIDRIADKIADESITRNFIHAEIINLMCIAHRDAYREGVEDAAKANRDALGMMNAHFNGGSHGRKEG